MIFRNSKKARRDNGKIGKETRRRRLASLMSRAPQLEALEARNLLAAYVVDVNTDGAADISGVADGDLSLREAIIAANTNAAFGDAVAGAADGDSITFAGALAGTTITLGNGQFNITDDLTIDGSAGGATRITLDAGGLSRIFDINTSGGLGANLAVSLSDLIATNGDATGSTGGGIRVTDSPVTLTNVDVTNSSATNAGGLESVGGSMTVNGGTISGNSTPTDAAAGFRATNGTVVDIDGTTIQNNSAALDGGGLYIGAGSTVTIDNATITGNTAGPSGSASGGGIFNDGSLTVTDSSIDSNIANRAGGGIEVGGSATLTSLTDVFLDFNVALGTGAPGNGGGLHVTGISPVNIIGGTVTGNTAAQEGGGLWNGGGTMTIAGTTVDSNTAFGTGSDQAGGGIFNAGGTVNLQNMQLTFNIANTPDGSGGGGFSDGGTFNVMDSLIANNDLYGIVYANDAGGTQSGNTFLGNVGGAIGPISGTPGDDDIVVTATSITIGSNVLTLDPSLSDPIVINGGDGNDTLTVDFSGGPILVPIFFNGNSQTGAPGDSLRIVGTFVTQILTYTTVGADGNDGDVFLDDGVSTATITYTGMEPISAGNAANTILNLPIAVANDAILQDSANAGEIEIIDNGATFENTIIPNPTNSLTVNLGDSGDQLQVNALDAAYAASLIVNGGAANNDNVQLTNVDLINTPGRGLWVTETETLGLTGGTISGNTVLGDVGGGVKIDNSTSGTPTTATIDGTTITGNTADSGGGVWNGGGSLTIQNGALIDGNTAQTFGGGGVFNDFGGILDVDGSTISNNDNLGFLAGGGIVNFGTATIQGGAVVSGNTSVSAAGGVFSDFGSLVVDNSTVSNNTAGGEGGGIFSFVSTTIQNGSAIDGNTATLGGGIFSQGPATLTIQDASTISGNTATDSGGGIWNGGAATIQGGTTIDGNNASNEGGGIFNNGGLTLGDATLSNNTAGIRGGGLSTQFVTITVDGTTITGNTASGNNPDEGGGGIANTGTVNIANAQITNNTADGTAGSGGGILNGGFFFGSVSVVDSTISGNVANRAGGGIEAGDNSLTDLTNVNLDNNNAGVAPAVGSPGNGGGLHITGNGAATIIGGTVSGNQAAQEGGGLWNGSGTMTIDGTMINGNTAQSANATNDAQGGGGIFNQGGFLDVSNAVITNNTALDPDAGGTQDDGGGGIFDNGGIVTITDTTISGNTATDGLGNGGGILTLVGNVTISGGTISGNQAARAGGGIENSVGFVTLTNVTVDSNTAGINGGGLHVSGAGNTNVTDGTFQNNVAQQEGGGLWNGSGTMTIDGTTISGNTASGGGFDQGGGGIFNAGGTLLVDGATIDNNTANNSPGAGGGVLSDGGFTQVINSTVTNNDNYGIRIINGSGNVTNNNFAGNVTADLLVDGTNAANTFFIDPTSIFFGPNFISYDGTVPDLDVRGLDGDDTFNVTPSVDTQIFIDGGSPVLPASPGDTLNLTLQNEANVYSDKATPPNVSITTTVSGVPTQPVTFISIETFLAAPGAPSQTVNFFGDNNGATSQTDNLVLVGRDVDSHAEPIPGAQLEFQPDADGDNEFTWSLNGSPEFGFRNVAFLNFDSGEEVDTLEITPYADDQPQGWDIDVFYNEGAPAGSDGDQVDLLIYNTAAFGGMTSENIVIRPAGQDNGELVVTNLGFGTPIVDIDFVANTDIIVNDNDGFLNDTDTLTLLGSNPDNPGTSGNETVNVDLTAAGGVGTPRISVLDGAAILYNVRSFSGFDTVNLDLLGGDDGLNFTPDTADANGLQQVTINYDGGDPVSSDTLTVNSDASARVTQGVVATSGVVDQLGAGVGDVNFRNVELVGVSSATAASTLTVRGTNDNDTIALAPTTTANEARVWLNDGAVVTANAGGGNANFATVSLQGRFGDDQFSITPVDGIGVNVLGGDPTASDSVTVNGTSVQDTVTYTPTAIDGGTVQVNALGLVTLSTVKSLTINGLGGNDALTVVSTAGQVTHTPGDAPDAGTLRAGSLLPLDYAQLGATSSVTVSGAETLVVRGTDTGDVIAVEATTGTVTHTLSSGEARVPIVQANVNALVIDALSGDDTVTVAGDHPYTGGLAVNGGQPDNGSDILNFVGSGVGAVVLDLAAQTITETGFGAVSYAGMETVNIDANSTFTVDGTLSNDIFNVTPLNNDIDGSFDHSGSVGVAFNYTNATTVAFNGLGGAADELNILGDAVADTITSAASAVTVDGSTVTLGTGLESLQVFGLGGNDNVNLGALVFAGIITIRGADGNDTLVGSGQDDILFGGAGNDILIGGGGSDTSYGEDGNDTFGNPTLAADGTPDDPGTDFNFGGNGFDNFVWEPGDGADFNNGGDDAADIFRFFGNAAANTFVLRPGGTPTHFNALFGAAVIDNHGIEDVLLDPLGDNDTISVDDLFQTEVLNVTIVAGGGDETINVAGRTMADDLTVTGAVSIEGLTYDINISGSDTSDSLVISGNEGDDSIKVEPGVEASIAITLNGDAGDDFLSADAIINGGAGNDTIVGGAGDDTLNGNAGDDTFLYTQSNLGGTDTIDGGAGADRVLVQGGLGVDDIDVTATTIEINSAGPVTIAGASANVELLQIEAGDGNNDVDVTGTPPGGFGSIEINAGDGTDDINVDGAVTISAVIRGGSGNDTLRGGAGDDTLFGGAGNDILIGGGGSDFQYGEDGNDIFGNPSLASDGVADDPGVDFNFGGNGFDNFVWEPGDGADFNNGGDDAADIFRFFGSAAADIFVLRSGGTPTHFNAVIGGTTIDNHGVEDVRLDPLGGNDTISVDDLFATEVVNVTILAGGGDETITVAGRTTGDDLNVTSPAAGTVGIEGLTYDVNITGSATADSLTINTFEGDDSIDVDTGVETSITSTLNGGDGDDTLTGTFNTANGNSGNDTIIGGANDQTINGGAGEDTMVGGDGNDTFDGGANFDTILIEGTSGADVIDVLQPNATTLNHTVNGNAQVDTLVVGTVEEALVVAGNGADLIRVNWNDPLTDGINDVRMTVVGGDDGTSDRLAIVDDGNNDLVLYRKSQQDDTGTVQIRPTAANPLLAVFTGVENLDFVDGAGNAIDNSGGSQLVVFKHDPFESNDDRFTSTYLGSGDVINVDPTIDPGPPSPNPFGLVGDSDFYRVVAETNGTLDFQVYFRQIAGLPNNGNLDINVRDSAGNIIANFGVNDANDNERVRIPAVEGQTYFLEVFGNGGNAINVYNFSVVNHAPPTPYDLELDDNPANGQTNPPGTQGDTSDTGRSQFDNHTYDTTPTIFFRLDDGIFLHDLPGNPANDSPPDQVIPIPFRAGLAQPTTPGFAIAIFDEGNSGTQTGTAPQTSLGFASATAQEGVYAFTVPVALSEGSHFLTARVQMIDPATNRQTGFGPRSESLEIVVDATPPPVSFGLATISGDGLHPDSDSGDPVVPATLVDRITNDETPTFFGRAEANTIVRLYVDLDNTNTLTPADLLIGQTVANPLDGTEQLETPANPNEPGGQWEITSTVNMNDPLILSALGLPKDGLRTILLSAEDLSGNITAPDANVTLQIFMDTQGPQVTSVFISNAPAFNLFTLKPATPQPTPRVDSLTISVRDLPNRVAQFLYAAISNGPPAPLDPIVLVGDHSGVIPIASLAFNGNPLAAGNPATGNIVLNFSEPLPDDRYTLTLSDNLIDPVGNRLDGESNAAEPIGVPEFQQLGRTTGDGIPGGDFFARFTVDSRPEVATWASGVVYADINGNFVWDPEGQDNDAVNRDFAYNFGEITDAYFAGNFAPAGAASASGFDKLSAYGAFNGQYQFFLDTDDDGVGDTVGAMAFQVNAIPVAGNFSAAHPGDEIGAFDGRNWYLDVNGNNNIDANERFPTNLLGIPVVGDFNGDGNDDLATFNNNTNVFEFDLDRNGTVDDTLTFGFSGFGDRPVAGDVNLDGIDDIVMWVTDQEGQLPKESGEFHFLVSDQVAALPRNIFDPFSPAPLGNDLISQYGDEFGLPLIGNFDPPIGDDGEGAKFVGSLTNELNPLDTTVDGIVTARDALVVINALGRDGFNPNANPLRVVASLGGYRLDASQDGKISALDALRVINGLARQSALAEEAEQVSWANAADYVIADVGDDDDDLLALLALDQEQSRVKS